jgi:hypothetical protein
MPRGRPKKSAVPPITGKPVSKRRLSSATIQRAEHHAYDRAADLAKSYAERYEAEARTTLHKRRRFKSDDWSAEIKAGHWRIIEKEIRALARQPEAADTAG